MPHIIEIEGNKIKRGMNVALEINIARLPSGTQIQMPVYVFRSRHDGPTMLICGGLHGDEVNGIEIVRRLIDDNVFERMQGGTVVAVPIINVYGFINFMRDVPDGKDINRSFPGNENGSLASHLAWVFTNRILSISDIGVDFHTGGASRTNYPQIRFADEDAKAREIAQAFGAPISLKTTLINNSLREQAFKMGKSIVVYEGGESMRFDELSIVEGIRGVQRTMKHFGMIKTAPKHRQTKFFNKSSWVRADTSGLFRALKPSGCEVKKGEMLGVINDPTNRYESHLEAAVDGFIIGHNNLPVVHRGDALFHVGIL